MTHAKPLPIAAGTCTASILSVVALLAAALALVPRPADAQPSRAISPAELASLIEQDRAPVILDVRTREEFAAGHIPGAINIPHDELPTRLVEIADHREREVVVHCHAGPRAGFADRILRAAEFTNLRQLEGHMRGWWHGGHPVAVGRRATD